MRFGTPGQPFSRQNKEAGILAVQRIMGWYQTLDFGEGLRTPGLFDHSKYLHHYGFPEDLSGLRALDIGTSNGFFAFEMERRGAKEVVAIDIVPRDVFMFSRRVLGSHVRYVRRNIYDLSPSLLRGKFDLVFCGDLLLHLDDIVGAARVIRSLTRSKAIISTAFVDGIDESQPIACAPLMEITTRVVAGEGQGVAVTYPLTWVGNRKFYEQLFTYVGFRKVTIVSTHVFRPTTDHNTDIGAETSHIVVHAEV